MPDRSHGKVPPRGLTNTPTQRSYDGRFGRMFQPLATQPAYQPDSPADLDELRIIASSMREMSEKDRDNERIPAGYVYLGQFIDHDLTFDPSSQLERRNDPDALINFRTPRFDLDSVYGSGPDDEPFQYEPHGVHDGYSLLVDTANGPDLPRNQRGRAIIGDPKNDENGIVSQLHLAFINFHNRIMDDMMGAHAEPIERFKAAQRRAQWHYQWVVAHDFLRRVIGDELHSELLGVTAEPDGATRETMRLRFYRYKRHPYLPVEFSVAAYRFGHSQIRDSYTINSSFTRRLFDPAGDDFRGFQALRPGWQASWPFFFPMDTQDPQFSRAIDSSIAPALLALQGGSGDDADLALRNLRRGAALSLPSGQAVATEMNIEPLTDEDLAPAAPGKAPLWYYILKEAHLLQDGQYLGPVGGRIIGETLLGLLRADPQSYFNLDPTWKPTIPTRHSNPQQFDMVDLLNYAVPEQTIRF